MRTRRHLLALAALTATLAVPARAQDAFDGDPFKSFLWAELKKEFLGPGARVQFDERVKVQGPAFAEDPMNVPITVSATGLAGVERVMVLVDRNPIRKVLELYPAAAQPTLGFRFKLEQASPVRALALTKDGVWHVGGTWVDSSGGGCTVSGGSRKDGSWTTTLGQVNARLFSSAPGQGDAATRLRLRVMHPMDTGLVNGIPAFYISKLSVRDAADRELARLATFEPVSENPVFSFDFAPAPRGPLRVVGVDNNGNRIDTAVN
ncbi:putative secreted protein [Burkholderiales bacterium JOSHI_001]|nr:putative secreted protein [Burkholderiales bacterium JOSHI_001]